MGMAGVMAAVMHAPLMAIFLTTELTGGYDLFLPLMIHLDRSLCNDKSVRTTPRHIPYVWQKKGELLSPIHKDKAVLTLLKMDSVIEKDFIEVHPNMSLGDMVKIISQSHRNIFPVTDNDNTLLGIVILDDIRNIMFRPELYNRFYVRNSRTMPQ